MYRKHLLCYDGYFTNGQTPLSCSLVSKTENTTETETHSPYATYVETNYIKYQNRTPKLKKKYAKILKS
jgi:hypothetical protein